MDADFGQQIYDAVWNFFADDWVKALAGALIGGAISGGTALAIERQRASMRTLATLNAALTVLVGHLNRTLVFKQQMSLPRNEELDAVLATFAEETRLRVEGTPLTEPRSVRVRELTNQIVDQPIEFSIDIQSIAQVTANDPDPVTFLMKSNEQLQALNWCIKYVNEIIEEMRIDEGPDRFPRYMGVMSSNGMTDNRLPEATRNLLNVNDHCLFFLHLAIKSIQKLSSNVLSRKLARRVFRYDVVDPAHADLMPAEDHLAGWAR